MMYQINGVPPSRRVTHKDTTAEALPVNFDYGGINLAGRSNDGITPSALRNDARQLTEGLQGCQDCQPSEPDSVGTLTTWRDTRAVTSSVSWAWDQWLPNGFLTMIASEVGQGKSILALWIAGLFTTGEPFPTAPDGIPRPGIVLWIETEQGQAMNLDRLTKFGLDDSMFLNPLPDPMDTVQLESADHRDIIMARAKLPEVAVIVVDSLSGSHRQKENDTGMIEIMDFLARLARDTNKPVIVIHHFNKLLTDGSIPSLGKVRGSTSIVQLCRVVWAIDAPNQEDPNHKRLSVIKSNLALKPEPIGFRIAEADITFTDPPEASRKQSKLDDAVGWLLSQLEDGTLAQQVIEQRANEANIPMRTLRRAKKNLAVKSQKKPDGWYWTLPPEDDHEQPCETVGNLGNVVNLEPNTGNRSVDLFGGTQT